MSCFAWATAQNNLKDIQFKLLWNTEKQPNSKQVGTITRYIQYSFSVIKIYPVQLSKESQIYFSSLINWWIVSSLLLHYPSYIYAHNIELHENIIVIFKVVEHDVLYFFVFFILDN